MRIGFDDIELAKLEKEMFRACRGANEQLFKGLITFINSLHDENQMILEEIQFIKENLPKKRTKATKKKDDEIVSNKIKEGIDKMSTETKEKLKKDIEEAMTISKMINSPGFGISKE